MSQVGLVTTFRFTPSEDSDEQSVERCWSVLSSFLLFHLAKGVDHVFLYADADDHSNDVYIDRIARNFHSSQVSVDVRSEAQIRRQRSNCRLWYELGSFSSTEVPARQSLNAEDALTRAAAMRLDWLLHLDIDELFYTSQASLKPHFEHLTQLGVEQMTYINHEAVPTHKTVNDHFSEIQLFLVNHLTLPLSHEVGECTRFWRQKRKHGQYMLAYDNGKSAVRVLAGRVVPQSVHRWRTLRVDERNSLTDSSCEKDQGEEEEGPSRTSSGSGCVSSAENSAPVGKDYGIEVKVMDTKSTDAGQGNESKIEQEHWDAPLVSRTALADPRELRFNEVLECNDPVVLHYPSCGLDWLRDKYRLLGSFPSSWFGGKLPIAPCFHLDARDAFDKTNTADSKEGKIRRPDMNEENAGMELYRREVMLCPEENAQQMKVQLRHGVLRTIIGAARVIKHTRDIRASLSSADLPASVSAYEEEQTDETASVEIEKELSSQVREITAKSCGESPSHSASSTTVADTEQLSKENDASADTAVAGSGFENSWILAAVSRDYL